MEETVPRKMRRLNTSVDVIPIIQGTSSDDFPQLIEKRKKSENKKPNNIYTELKSRVQKVRFSFFFLNTINNNILSNFL